MIAIERIDANLVPWTDLDCIGEANVFQTKAWIDFVAETQEGRPVVAAVKSNGGVIGYFFGLIVHKFGLKILGSPFRGWTTYFMGFNLPPGSCYREVLQALPAFAFDELGCHYLEIIDPNVKKADLEGLPYRVEALPWFAIDLTPTEDELFASMKHNGRNNIRKAIKSGVVIEATEAPEFAREYYEEYASVLKLKSLAPTYSLDTVRRMIDHMQAIESVLLLRAKNAENEAIATGIFVGKNKTGVFWGAASKRDHQAVRPNEPLAWDGMKAMKARGIQILHLGGECEQYKEKLGCYEVEIFRLMKARNETLDRVIHMALSDRGAKFKNWALRRL